MKYIDGSLIKIGDVFTDGTLNLKENNLHLRHGVFRQILRILILVV